MIAYGQPSNDSVTITREQQRKCLEWYFESIYKDSIILQSNKIINFKDSTINLFKGQNNALTDTLTQVRYDNTTLQKKVRRNRRIAIGGISGFVAVLVLIFTVK